MAHRVGKLLLAGWFACLGCSGGQTGDAGTDDFDCIADPQPETSVADVDAMGFPLGPWLQATFGAEQRLEWDLRVMLPPSFFEQRGLVYPALDPTTAAHVVLTPTGRAQMLLAPSTPTNDGKPLCVDQARVELNTEIDFTDFGETQTGSGTFTIDATGAFGAQSLSLGDLGSDCGLMKLNPINEPQQVYCNSRADGNSVRNTVIGTDQCGAPDTWPEAPIEPTTGETYAAFFAHAGLKQPVPLSCRKADGSMVPLLTASISLTVADRVCQAFSTQAAASVQLSTGDDFEDLGATVGYKGNPCSPDPTPSPQQPPVCPTFVVQFDRPTVNSGLAMQVVIHDDGSQTVGIQYFDPRYRYLTETPGPYTDCSGRLEIPATQ